MSGASDPDRRVYRVVLPGWGRWLDLLDAGGDGADPPRLVGALLTACTETEADGRWLRLTAEAVNALPTAIADDLADQALSSLEAQRQRLAPREHAHPPGLRLTGNGIPDLLLRPWSFGERSQALRGCLTLCRDDVHLEHGRLERAEVLTCTRLLDEAQPPLTLEAIDAWPIAVGEAVSAALARLNEPASGETEVLERCAEAGIEHPDLDLAVCCGAFGWTPDQVDAVPAAQLRRLLNARHLIDDDAVPSASAPAVSAMDDLTRILVHDA